eukprot:1105053-Alexandrium_andersonii.AAC.1
MCIRDRRLAVEGRAAKLKPAGSSACGPVRNLLLSRRAKPTGWQLGAGRTCCLNCLPDLSEAYFPFCCVGSKRESANSAWGQLWLTGLGCRVA